MWHVGDTKGKPSLREPSLGLQVHSLSVPLEQLLEPVKMLLTAMVCVACGRTQGLEKGPRYSSQLDLQVPPA